MERAARRLVITAAAILVVLIGSVGALWRFARPADLVIGSKNFTESRLLAEIMAQLAERHGVSRVQRHDLGSTSLCWDAVNTGAIDAYPEYTGTLLADVLKQSPQSDPALALKAVQSGMRWHPEVLLGSPFGLNDTYVLAMRQDHAQQLGVTRISDLVRHPGLIAGFTSEFNQRADGWPGLAKHYGLQLQRPPVDLGPGHMYQAVRDGQVALISAFSTDARLLQFGLLPLRDDLGFFPAYQALPVMRRSTADRFAAVVQAWESLAGRIDDATMMQLNQRVDLGGETVAAVATSFLASLSTSTPQPAANP